jgi:uncharacterized membrane protein (DUF4010 family)
MEIGGMAWAEALAPFAGVGLAFALGLLIGIERGWSQRLEPDGSRVAGIRTFALLGLAGGVAGEAAARLSPLLGAALLAAAAAPLLIGYARAAARGELSATTTVVGVITLALGLLAASGHMALAGVCAAVVTQVLAQRRKLHAFLDRLSEAELQAIARFAIVALAVLPLLPDRELGPLGAWNPRQIWMVVVLVSGLSLAGYAAAKRLGAQRGLLATAAAGAIVSSTAVTAALAGRLRKGEEDAAGLVAGIALASAIMFVRVMVLVALLAPFALGPLALAAAPGALASAAFVAWSLRRRPAGDPSASAAAVEAPSVRNPFDLGPAFLLAGVVMVVSLAARWALRAFGDAGLVTVLGISGMVDVDAAVIAMSGLPPGALTRTTAGYILAAPILANTLVKAALTLAVARGPAGWRGARPLLASIAAGLAGAALIPVLAGE